MDVGPIDVYIRDEGTLVMFKPETEAAKAWWAENVEDEADYQRVGDYYAVDHRMANAIYIGLVETSFHIDMEA